MNLLIFFFAVPPSIIDARTSADIVVKEGSPVNLSCDARGSPRPKIMWKREDADLIRYNGGKLRGPIVYFIEGRYPSRYNRRFCV